MCVGWIDSLVVSAYQRSESSSVVQCERRYPECFVYVVVVESKGTADADDVIFRRELEPVALRQPEHKAKRCVVHDEVVTLVAVPFNPMLEDCCAEFSVGFIIVLGELEGHA